MFGTQIQLPVQQARKSSGHNGDRPYAAPLPREKAAVNQAENTRIHYISPFSLSAPFAPMTISDGPIPLLSPQLSAILSRIIGSRFTRTMSSITKKGTIRIVIITHSYPDRTKKELLLSIGCVHSLHDDGTTHNTGVAFRLPQEIAADRRPFPPANETLPLYSSV